MPYKFDSLLGDGVIISKHEDYWMIEGMVQLKRAELSSFIDLLQLILTSSKKTGEE